MLGKAVEMLANSIAEMRTYGEGFIISDQSPGLLDLSVIRNTNTKIILRLPDFSDRELVGKSAGLSDEQIIELVKLERGVAAISQSDWIEPVLCQVDRYIKSEASPANAKNNYDLKHPRIDTSRVSNSIMNCLMNEEIYRRGDRIDIQKLKKRTLKSKLDTVIKCDLIDYINAEKEDAVRALRKLTYDFFNAENAINESSKCGDLHEWVHSVADHLMPNIKPYSKRQIDLVMALIIYEKSIRDATYDKLFCRFTEVYKKEGGVF